MADEEQMPWQMDWPAKTETKPWEMDWDNSPAHRAERVATRGQQGQVDEFGRPLYDPRSSNEAIRGASVPPIEAAKGVPIAGAYVPTSKYVEQTEKEEPFGTGLARGVGSVAGSVPFFAAGPGGVIGATGTSAALSGADTAARGGSASDIVRGASIGGATNFLGSGLVKAAGLAARPFVPSTVKEVRYHVDNPLKRDPLEGLTQPELERIFKGPQGPGRVRASEVDVEQPLSHEKVQAVGTGLGMIGGYFLGHPEAGFLGYGISPGLAPYVAKAAPWVAKNAEAASLHPVTQAVLNALSRKASKEIE